jgi:tripartite-type tricarboxylate transporter receptor subunit TctC
MRHEGEQNMGIPNTASRPEPHGVDAADQMNRREEIAALAGAALLPTVALAQPYPGRPIKLIVPFAVGGAADLFGRSFASGLSVELGQQVVVETRAGAGGLTGVDAVAKNTPDGYTICLA